MLVPSYFKMSESRSPPVFPLPLMEIYRETQTETVTERDRQRDRQRDAGVK